VLAGLTEWLDAYGRAWEDRDPAAASELFTEDAVYQWGPFGRKLRGKVMIREAWADAVETQENVKFGYEVLTATARGGIVRWWCAADLPAQQVHSRAEGIFRLAFDESGLCTSLEEWWNSSDEPLESAPPRAS
jgi:ketosteroid isomerase-like protein